jgi:LysM repeat protein
MPATLYHVKKGDTFWLIAQKFKTTVASITKANVICNSSLIFPGEAFIIPDPSLPLPKAGGIPYYVVRPSDTLGCLAREFGTEVDILAASNRLPNPNQILAGQELLVTGQIPNPSELKTQWENLGGWPSCDLIPPISIHGIYYNGTFLWEALGPAALRYLIPLLQNPCSVVRIYTVISLARIACDHSARAALTSMADDPDPTIRALIPLALKRIEMGSGKRNIHLITTGTRLYAEPNLNSPYSELPAGTEIKALRWSIPSPSGEEGPRGDIQIYDRVKVLATGKAGFIPRIGFNEIVLV